ncbi:hypothetical protein [Lentzea sp. NEAU-D7]|uniref:hypothetical protein n=1 Tax=Lentzea sp. NEAU-D7 TaxID=2994667 RepID=UPI00224B7D45|nr:hypothetical protein [Lentzea sp. NEAU-D7]MCX2948105.1 hypothetical protein [Lentzea sp. NEAU-D7]
MRALLLRTAALGGLTAGAWLLSGTTASASPEEPPAVEVTTEVATEAAAEAPQLLDDPAGWAKAFTASLTEKHQPEKLVPPPVPTKPEEPQEEPDEGPILDFTGGSHSNSRSGTISNEAPPEVIAAKAQVRAAKIAARLAAQLPPPPPPPPPPAPVLVAKKAVQLLPDLPVPAPVKTEPAPANDYNWSVPGPDAPLPAPQQAPVVTTATASSGHTDNSGGTRGVLAVLTSHNSLFPPATWSVEERRDGTAPGSDPGLPSTSPD